MSETRSYLITVSPVGPGRYLAQLGGEVLIASSRQPFLDSARILLGRGVAPGALLVMRHEGDPTVAAVAGTVGWAAEYTVEEADRGVPRFRPWKGLPLREGSALVEFQGEAAE
jgi:hypothetical protein